MPKGAPLRFPLPVGERMAAEDQEVTAGAAAKGKRRKGRVRKGRSSRDKGLRKGRGGASVTVAEQMSGEGSEQRSGPAEAILARRSSRPELPGWLLKEGADEEDKENVATTFRMVNAPRSEAKMCNNTYLSTVIWRATSVRRFSAHRRGMLSGRLSSSHG